MIKTKRIQKKENSDDGYRILVERTLPRGLSETRRSLDLWLPDIAPSDAIPKYYEQYQRVFELPVILPIKVNEVTERNGRFIIRTNGSQFSSRGLINATGTWKTPLGKINIPDS